MEIIKALPVSSYKSQFQMEVNQEANENNICIICLETFRDGEDIMELPCLHQVNLN